MLQLKKFPDIPDSTREEGRESRPHPEEPRFRHIAREVGSFPCVVGKEFPAFLSHLKRRRSPLERQEELQGRATIPRVPQMSQSIPEDLVFTECLNFHAEERLTLRWHVVQTCGKPRGKASRDSHRSLDPREGKRESAASAREESSRACPHSRRRKTPLGRLEKYPKIHVSTGEESSGQLFDSHMELGPSILDSTDRKFHHRRKFCWQHCSER